MTFKNTRITQGLDTFPGEYPWQAAMFAEGNTYICGGSIIGDFYILTAAHCVYRLVVLYNIVLYNLQL